MDHLFPYINKDAKKLFDQISRRAGKAITQYGMIAEGDTVIVGVSGGKDSMTLLNIMLHRQSIAPIDFKIIAVHVDSGIPGVNANDLQQYFEKIRVPYHIERLNLFNKEKLEELNCFWCSWNRRKALFQYATRINVSKIALAHHLDDIVETILINQFFKGEISAMCPRQDIFDGKISLIRPLAYENEQMIVSFAKAAGLDAFESCRCPVSAKTQRAAIKHMLKGFEKVCPSVKTNIFNSLDNIKPEYLPLASLRHLPGLASSSKKRRQTKV